MVSIIGLGYVGLPLALLTASKGKKVIGVDKNEHVLNCIKKNEPLVQDNLVQQLIIDTKIELSTNVTSSEIYIICVPTPVTSSKDPDLSYVKKSCSEIAKVIEDDQLVIIESTINPGVTREIVKPILEKSKKRFLLAHCPERINPGDEKWDVSNIPRVVGGIDRDSGIKAYEFYSLVIDANITLLNQLEAAEATKILENTFRDINIAFINEMAMSFHRLGIDITEVIKGASTKPFAFLPHYPGIGVGGHCIAVDPYYMIKKGQDVGFIHDFLIAARRINNFMPEFTVSILQDALNDAGLPLRGTKLAVLGVSYKPDINDDRESPFYEVVELLRTKGADVLCYDPYFPNLCSDKNLNNILKKSDAALLVTGHKIFLDNTLYISQKVVVDGRNLLDKEYFAENKIIYRGIGISI